MVNTKGCVELLKKVLNLREDFFVRLSKKAASYFISILKGFLDDREFRILDWHFGLHEEKLSQKKIGKKLGITSQRVQQIELRVLRRKLSRPWDSRRRWIFKLFLLDKADLVEQALLLHDENESLKTESIKLRSPAALKEMLNILIDDTGLSVRSRNILRRGGIKTIGELVQKTKRDLLILNGMGSKSFKEIEDFLAEYGLSLKE